MAKYSCTVEELDAGMDREAAALEYAELKRKWAWLRMRANMNANAPLDDPFDALQDRIYRNWYRDYCATDKLDPLPRCQPGTVLWREMNRLATRDDWPTDGSDFVRSLHP